jgi:hypothetical protein
MAKVKQNTNTIHVPTKKKSSTSGKHSMLKTSSMNKSKKRGYKKYRGQGR